MGLNIAGKTSQAHFYFSEQIHVRASLSFEEVVSFKFLIIKSSKLLSEKPCRYSFTWHTMFLFLSHVLKFLYTERGNARGKNEQQEAVDDDDDVIKNYVIVPLLP